jgi:hypothetical protein
LGRPECCRDHRDKTRERVHDTGRSIRKDRHGCTCDGQGPYEIGGDHNPGPGEAVGEESTERRRNRRREHPDEDHQPDCGSSP